MLRLILVISTLMLSGCSLTPLYSDDKNQQVEIRIDGQFDPAQCEYLGEVTGSEGHWYSYLFYTNDDMIKGATNDLKNNAMAIGADTVFMVSPQYFVTSFTVLGAAYRCK
ncbi:DUF4156 domain-containing protein [uncultured Vibrio sp.]|uniref:DUF4156 domain-containing protein n=1 Tax=Vibrio sp. TaxID=678 RepID=UPI002AA837CC|nr:DUF4156 domain-containing protein [uncultured Vibrio sp.]